MGNDRDQRPVAVPHVGGVLGIGPDLSCAGIGPLDGTRVRVAGLYGGGSHTTTADGWRVEVIFDADVTPLRAAGSGQTLAVATSGDVTLWPRG